MKGPERFDYFLAKLEELLSQSAKELNPALWLYSNNARTPLFMLEGLSRLYSKMHNKNKFEKLKDHFKLLEDGLGAIDYYDNEAKKPGLPADISDYLRGQAREKLQHLNEILIDKEWIGENADRLKKIRKKLSEADWLREEEEAEKVKSVYEEEIASIKAFIKEAGPEFSEMETQVHEIRRDLRWLSIYPQALRGLIQLKETNQTETATAKYLTPEIVNSPYNKMPDRNGLSYILYFDKNYFLSLSWLIAETGVIKDKGLGIFAVAEAVQQIQNCSGTEAKAKACAILNVDPSFEDQLLNDASALCNQFIKEGIPDKILLGVAA